MINPFKLFFLSTLTLVILSCSSDSSDDSDDTPPMAVQLDIDVVDNSVENFLQTHNAPGAALAVSVDGKMVYSKGYGLADVEANISTKPDDLFRIASISKVITSTAIMQLVDEGLITVDHKVFGVDGILGNSFGSATLTTDELDVTVDDLLLHQQGGWVSASGYDIIDHQPQLNNTEFLEYILNNSELTHSPGEIFRYNNVGYWMLARIIEEISGQTYENYVRNMLSYAGVTTFKTTTFREDDREPNEVKYYGHSGDEQYIYTIASRRDGDGGVVISAPDLLRFLNAVDGSNTRPDIVSASSQQLMKTTTSLSNLGRGFGVWEDQNVLYFTGSLPGNRSWFMIGENGVTATFLVNYRDLNNAAQYDEAINNLVLNIVNNSTIPWQTDLDQF